MDLEQMRETLRAQAKARAGVGVKLRFDEAFRAQAVEYVRSRQAQGVTQEAAAKELGMSSWTLSRWHQQVRRGAVRPPGGKEVSRVFRPVALKRESEAERLVVHAAGGVRVEGLTLRQVAELLRELGG
ncbi:transposase [Myxococcus qinghaiensis]|uniref:transposase n=1 Tax=Myxococcus qinghaiensis TaxID=2906758 RepID=UPI0020A76261|nr:helix-turn-helix transcriptional regulator [Myxococcus qinghaiensis]MCP3170257.1 helix-turn-helix domain-containing protein [Myxococcus qinghaiensis]